MNPGDESFEAAFESCSAPVFAFALRRVGTREDAEDVLAETFAVAWRRRDELPDPPLPYLYAVAANVVKNSRRSSRRLGRLRGKLAGQRTRQVDDHAEHVAANDAFAVAFAGLSESQREILRLVAWEGLDTRDGAAALECSETAFKVRLHRARRELEKRIAEAGHVEGEMPKSTLTPDAEAK